MPYSKTNDKIFIIKTKEKTTFFRANSGKWICRSMELNIKSRKNPKHIRIRIEERCEINGKKDQSINSIGTAGKN